MSSRSTMPRLAALIQAKLRERGIGLRAAAEESRISPSTLSRLQRGASASLPDAETLSKLAAWLGVPLGTLLADDREAPTDGPQLSTPEVVEVHLRADKHLSPKTAETLAKMFRLLYEQFSETERKDPSDP